MTDEIPWTIECGDGPSGLLTCPHEVDHIWCDVPYGQHVEDGNAAEVLRDNDFGFEPMTTELLDRTAAACAARCRRWTLISTSEEETHLWREALSDHGMNVFRTGHWIRQRNKPQMDGRGPAQGSEAIVIAHSRIGPQRWNGGGRPALWYAPIVQGDAKVHPTQKPEELLKQLIEDFSDPGELWADPMAGSFSCGIVAVALGRRFWGRDLQQKYVDLANERMKLPLFDKQPIQASLFEPRATSRAATARAELDHEILRLITIEGISKGDLLKVISASPLEIQRSLQRLRKSTLIRREGKTNDSMYFRASGGAPTQPSTGNAHP